MRIAVVLAVLVVALAHVSADKQGLTDLAQKVMRLSRGQVAPVRTGRPTAPSSSPATATPPFRESSSASGASSVATPRRMSRASTLGHSGPTTSSATPTTLSSGARRLPCRSGELFWVVQSILTRLRICANVGQRSKTRCQLPNRGERA